MKRWPTRPVGELVLPTEQRDPRRNPTDEFCYVDIAGVDNDAKAIVATKRIVGADAPSRARKVIREGDVIVSTVRPNLNAVALVPTTFDDQICSTGFSVLRPSEKVVSGYLFAFVRSAAFIDYLVARTTGANYPAVNDGEVKAVPIPVPPLTEQERIVKLLDEADDLRQLRAQADRRTAALIPALFYEMFGDPAQNPYGWRTARLDDVANKITDGEHQTPKRTTSGIKLLSARNVRDGFLDFSDVDYVNEDEHHRIKERCNPEQGDILLSCSGTIGRVAVVHTTERFSLVRSVALIKLKKELLRPDFLACYLRTPHLATTMSASANASSQANLFQNKIKALPVFIPTMTLQDRFVERTGEIRELGAAQATSRQRLEALFQSMLHRAFNGEF
ncbi:MAG: restriction endonuclease subunit S [Verrucomicrobiota bacterium]